MQVPEKSLVHSSPQTDVCVIVPAVGPQAFAGLRALSTPRFPKVCAPARQILQIECWAVPPAASAEDPSLRPPSRPAGSPPDAYPTISISGLFFAWLPFTRKMTR